MKFTKKTASLILYLLLCLSTTHAYANISMSVNKQTVSLNETLKLSIQSNDQAINIDRKFVSEIRENFDIVNEQSSTGYTSIKGRTSKRILKILHLRPLREGVFSLPIIQSSNQKKPITITINPNLSGNQNTAPNTNTSQINANNIIESFVETDLDKTQAHVQEQVILSVRLFSIHNILQGQIQPPTIKNVDILQLKSHQYQESVNGQQYNVLEFKFSLFPKKSGSLEIPTSRIVANISSPNQRRNSIFQFNVGKNIQLATPQALLEVLPVPNTFTKQATQTISWLPANNLNIKHSWNSELQNLTIGDTIQRTINIIIDGALPVHINDLSFKNITSLKVYADAPKKDIYESSNGVSTQVTQVINYIPSEAANFSLDPISITWWDNSLKTLRKTTLPSITLRIKNASGALTTKNLSTNNHATKKTNTETTTSKKELVDLNEKSTTEQTSELRLGWFLLSLIAIIGSTYLAYAFIILKIKRQTSSKKITFDETELEQACDENDAFAIQKNLLLWGQFKFPKKPIYSLSDLSNQLSSKAFQEQVSQLEKSLFDATGNNHWSAQTIKSLVVQERQKESHKKLRSKKNRSTNSDALPTLYPD